MKEDQSDILTGTIKADQAALDNLKVQKSYTTIRAPFSGRIGAANVKVGNFVRPADTAPLAVINQMAPVYVTFSVPQRVLVDLREAMGKGVSGVTATIPGHQRSESGKVAMVENTVDMATGMVTVRGIMNNENESLWPGTLVATKLDHPQRGFDRGADGRRAAQPERQFRLRGQGRRRQGPAGQGRPHRAGHVGDHGRARRRRKRRRRRAIAAVGWNAGRGRGPKRPERNR